MKKITTAWRTFRRMLKDTEFAANVAGLDQATTAPATLTEQRKSGPKRSEALTLLETLQREARFVDFMMEPLDGYSDAQIGAASRDVHRDSAKVLQRLFAPTALRSEEEGSSIEVPAGFDPSMIRLTGNVAGEAPYNGALRHHGWTATKCEVPVWTGNDEAAEVLAPAEIEMG